MMFDARLGCLNRTEFYFKIGRKIESDSAKFQHRNLQICKISNCKSRCNLREYPLYIKNKKCSETFYWAIPLDLICFGNNLSRLYILIFFCSFHSIESLKNSFVWLRILLMKIIFIDRNDSSWNSSRNLEII